MRGRWIIAVLVVLALVAGADYGWRRAKRQLRHAVQRAVQRVEAAHLPQRQVSSETRSLKPPGTGKLAIENPYGSVMVIGGTTAISLESRVFAAAATAEEARRRPNPFTVRVEAGPQGDQRITVKAKADDPNLPYMTINLTVRAPSDTMLTASSSSGDVEVHGFTREVTVQNEAGGNIVANCTGPVTATTASGHNRITGASRGVTAQTSSGGTALEAVSGPVVAETMSGSLTLRVNESSSIAASAMSGSIDVRVAAPFSGRMDVRCSSGSIGVALPPSSDCRVRAATGSGSITCALPLQHLQRAGPEVRGQLGAGRGYVEVTSTSGSILLGAL